EHPQRGLICPVNTSLTYFLITSPGLQTFPEFIAVLKVGDAQLGYCDSDGRTTQINQDWIKKLIQDDPHHLKWYTQVFTAVFLLLFCLTSAPLTGVHILQEMSGCEWDDHHQDSVGFDHYGYDGEEFTSFDVRTMSWVTQKNNFLINICPQWLKRYLQYGKMFFARKGDNLNCHATGFYPDRASMFWRKDGEEIHEDVDHGEILPNHDGTFQMRVDLNISSVKPEDWSRYDCVFHLSDKPRNLSVSVIVVVLVIVLIAAAGFIIYKNKGERENGNVINLTH
uniref:Ig-like domain-containing protein n=1 Tax=Anabas testudineus TaxID=64144 RepID=A0AAQ6IVQ7_ANATE